MIFSDLTTNHIIEVIRANVPLPSDDSAVEVTYFALNNQIKICLKSAYSAKLKACETAETLCKELTKPKKNGSHNSAPAEKIRQNSDILTDEAEESGYIADMQTGEVCRSVEGLKRSWRKQAELIYNNVSWELGLFVTCTLDCKPTFEQMSAMATAFKDWARRAFKGIIGFLFFEPHKDGSWHVHFILGFSEKIPNDFEKRAKNWWRKKNTVACENQIKIRGFKDFADLKRTTEYLNAAGSEKKRELIPLYPTDKQVMRHFGDVQKPNKALATLETAKEILGEEQPTMRKSVTVTDAETNVMVYSCSEFFFESRISEYHHKKIVTNPREAPNFVNRFNDYIYDNYTMRC